MFILRGTAVSLTFFVLLYCLLSVLVVCAWRGVMGLCGASARSQENMLFWIRLSPLLASAAATLTLAVPSFVLLEPRSIDEEMSVPLVLGLACLVLFAFGLSRVVIAQAKSSRVVREWLKEANILDAGVTVPTIQASRKSPPLALVGVCAPRVVVSEAAVALLSTPELRVAVRHEIAHMRSRDNLKKLVFHCSPFPGMASLEGAWQEAAELAADDAAVSNFRDALDLAATLIKLSRLIPAKAAPTFTMALVSGPGSVRVRVERLLAWDESRVLDVHKPWRYAVPVLAAILCTAALYSPALAQIHRVTEWLVR
ncbi:MAG: M48 family metalloprotease [Acidobacteriia bacterium]|nr:M48 family metalloprotease [Terriglobia bacterium]